MVDPMEDSSGEVCEPALHFHEFLFLLGLIAHDRINSNGCETIAMQLQDFYIQKLNFRKPSEAQANKDLCYQEVLDRVQNNEFGEKLSMDGESGDEEEWDSGSEEEEAVGSQKVIMELIQRK